MAADLPQALAAAIETRLEGASRRRLAERAGTISRAYRAGDGSAGVVRDADEAVAYAVSRMPATFAATRDALDRLRQRSPGFEPKTVLDVGCGPGTASWAADDAWPDVAEIVQVDRNAAFLDLARALGTNGPSPALREARQVSADLLAWAGPAGQFDLVLLGYALAELPAPRLPGLVSALWSACGGALVLVEPGTPAGYGRILSVRDALLSAGARILAPCPHEAACPLAAPDWCHFSVRLARRRDHMAAKSAELPFEDEKFSYLVAVREPLFRPAEASRILDRPATTKIGASAKICAPDGAARVATVPKRDKASFARARRLKWGDEL